MSTENFYFFLKNTFFDFHYCTAVKNITQLDLVTIGQNYYVVI